MLFVITTLGARILSVLGVVHVPVLHSSLETKSVAANHRCEGSIKQSNLHQHGTHWRGSHAPENTTVSSKLTGYTNTKFRYSASEMLLVIAALRAALRALSVHVLAVVTSIRTHVPGLLSYKDCGLRRVLGC